MERDEYARMAALEASLWWYRALHRYLIDRIAAAALPTAARVLDAGCGTGGFMSRLREARPDLALEGLDVDPEAGEIARRKSGLPVAVGTVDRMPYPSGSFSAIVSSDVLCHARVDQGSALAEFHRCLAPGGFLLLNLPAYEWLSSAHDRQVHTKRRYTARSADRLVRKAGFLQVSVSYGNSVLFPLMALHRLFARGTATASDVRPFPAWQDALFFSAMDVDRQLKARGACLPFGGSVRVEARR
jgi:SAM-dependent methyltransferase